MLERGLSLSKQEGAEGTHEAPPLEKARLQEKGTVVGVPENVRVKKSELKTAQLEKELREQIKAIKESVGLELLREEATAREDTVTKRSKPTSGIKGWFRAKGRLLGVIAALGGGGGLGARVLPAFGSERHAARSRESCS